MSSPNDELNNNFSIKTKEDIAEEEYYKKLREWYKLPMLRCPVCNFRNVYQISIKQHMQYSHRKGHNNEVTAKMTEKDFRDWEAIFAGHAPKE